MAGTDSSRQRRRCRPATSTDWPISATGSVLGSDFPNIPYPYAHQLEALDRLELGDDWLRAVLWHNGARLMRLAG